MAAHAYDNNNNRPVVDITLKNEDYNGKLVTELMLNVKTFYNPNIEPKKRKSLDTWLNNYQMTEKAWEISHKILATYCNNDSAEVANILYFSANTLHKKSRHDGGDLSSSTNDDLRRSLLELIVQFTNKKIVLNRLCLAYAALSVHRTATQPEKHPLEEIFKLSFFGNNTNKVYQKTLISAGVELFTVFLEEGTSDLLPIKEEVRELFIEKVRMHADNILQFLSACIENQISHPEKVFACLQSWIKYGEITPEVLANSSLLNACFTHLATDTITEILRCYNKIESDGCVIQAMIPLVMSLSENINVNDLEKADNVARILTSMGESYMQIICGPEDIGQEHLIAVLCKYMKHEDTEISRITLPFWEGLKYYLIDRVKRFKAVDNDGNEMKRISDKMRNNFSKYILQVFDVCLVHLNSIINNINGNEIEEEDCINDFGECVTSCSLLLDWQPCLVRGFENLTNVLKKAVLDSTKNPSENQYTHQMKTIHVHSSLRFIYYILRAGRKKEIIHEELVLTPLLNSIIPKTIVFGGNVVKIGLEIISIAAFWINARPASLNTLFPFIVNSLSLSNNKQHSSECNIASTAAYVLGDICHVCANSMPPEVLTVYNSIGQHGLALKDEIFVIEGMSAIVSKLSFSEAGKGLERLLTPMVNDLCSAIEKNNLNLVVRSLEHMVAVFKYATLNDQSKSVNAEQTGMKHPVLLLMNNVWHVFEQIIVKFYENENVMEKLCRVYKHSIRNAKHHFLPLLDKLLNQMVEVFRKCPIASFLYTCSICVGEFGPSTKPYNTFQVRLKVFQTYRELTNCMCQHLPDIESFIGDPSLVEDYFNLSNRVCKKSFDFFLLEENKDVVSICVRLGCIGLRLDHPEAWPTVSCFFHSFLTSLEYNARTGETDLSKSRKQCFLDILGLHCKEIVRSLIYSTGGGINARFVDDDSNDNVCISELFYVLLQIDSNIVCTIINECGIEENERINNNIVLERIISSKIVSQSDFLAFATKLNHSGSVKDVYKCVWDFHCLCRDKKWKCKRDNARFFYA